LILIAGRYEGIDERVIALDVDREISLGDFVLSGGEPAAIAVLDAVGRLVPGVLGSHESANQDSFSAGLLDHPHYTRPERIDGHEVPEVLLSGHHERIAQWRRKQALGRTWQRRPDLLAQLELSSDDKALLEEFKKESKP
jgi:tRNA-(guanine-N1)-methyltransferase